MMTGGTRLGAVLLAVAAALLSPLAHAQAVGGDRWQVYGTEVARSRDEAVPGTAVVTAQPRPAAGDPWSSGAGVPLPSALAAGQRVTAIFWAKAARPVRLPAYLQGQAPDYRPFAQAEVALTPAWQQLSVTGSAPTDLAAGTQSLSLQLGQAGTAVKLGPVVFLRGTPDSRAVAAAFAGLSPAATPVDVRIASEPGVTLAGTLHLPAGAGPFPLAVLIQGHGPNGRGGFTEVVRRLSADGIAALEYDKRGIGQSTGVFKEDIVRFTADAAAAVAAMRRRPEIDGSRIALVGHSQGGVIAPALASADPKIKGVAMLAGSVGDGLPYLRRAIASQLAMAGRPAASIDPAADAAITLLQARIDGRDPATIERLRTAVVDRFVATGYPRPQAEGALAMIDTEEAARANQLRSASDLRTLRVPVLAVFGARDAQVIAATEAPAARAALAGNPRARVEVLDGLAHWFQEGAVTGSEEEFARLGPNLGSPRIVALVGDWLRDTLARTAR